MITEEFSGDYRTLFRLPILESRTDELAESVERAWHDEVEKGRVMYFREAVFSLLESAGYRTLLHEDKIYDIGVTYQNNCRLYLNKGNNLILLHSDFGACYDIERPHGGLLRTSNIYLCRYAEEMIRSLQRIRDYSLGIRIIKTFTGTLDSELDRSLQEVISQSLQLDASDLIRTAVYTQ